MELIRCTHCNAAFPDSMTRCPRCGRDPDPPSPVSKVFKIGVLIFGAIGILLTILVLIFR